MTAYTDQGAKKIAVTDPVGELPASESLSVTIAADQAKTAPVSEEIELLRGIHRSVSQIAEVLLKARL